MGDKKSKENGLIKPLGNNLISVPAGHRISYGINDSGLQGIYVYDLDDNIVLFTPTIHNTKDWQDYWGLQGANSVNQGRLKSMLLPWITAGVMGGVPGLLGMLGGEAVNTTVDSLRGKEGGWAGMVSDLTGVKNPYGLAALSMTNPGYLLGGITRGGTPFEAYTNHTPTATRNINLSGFNGRKAMTNTLAKEVNDIVNTPLDIKLPINADKTRYKFGDVEINNPQLSYRLGPSVADDFLRKGVVEDPEIDEVALFNKFKAEYETLPESEKVKRGIFGYSNADEYALLESDLILARHYNSPMFSQREPWYNLNLKQLLTTAEPLGVANQHGRLKIKNPANGTFDVRAYPESRRVLLQAGLLTPKNTDAFILEPGYGYRKVTQAPSTIDFNRTLNSDLWLSVGLSNTPYYFNTVSREWEPQRLIEDARKGKAALQEWINSEAYREAAEANKTEASNMGYTYIPIYERPEFLSLIDLNGNFNLDKFGRATIKDFGDSKNTLGANTPGTDLVDLNIRMLGNAKPVYRHELGHALDMGYPSRFNYANPEELARMRSEYKYLKHKAGLVFKPESDYANQFDLSKEAKEAIQNARDFGEDLGLKIGEPYPGYEKALEKIESYKGLKDGLKNMFRLDEEHMPYVWKALVGTQFATAPFILFNDKQNSTESKRNNK